MKIYTRLTNHFFYVYSYMEVGCSELWAHQTVKSLENSEITRSMGRHKPDDWHSATQQVRKVRAAHRFLFAVYLIPKGESKASAPSTPLTHLHPDSFFPRIKALTARALTFAILRMEMDGYAKRVAQFRDHDLPSISVVPSKEVAYAGFDE